ncbi:hypothetical protein [Nocardia sp. NPDC052112]|uniref:hypothetical protein n=1 Tax=Nocardia sp. NPDC052112 TaxID=3155646 RepID=UPI003443188A
MAEITHRTAPSTLSVLDLPAPKSRARRAWIVATSLCIAVMPALSGCESPQSSSLGEVPDGWATLTTEGVDVSYPKSSSGGYTEESVSERSKYNAAAAVRTENGRKVSTITVQLDFTRAHTADQAAIGAEAGVQLGATLTGTTKIALNGAPDARRVDFAFTSSGKQQTPPEGTRVNGVILTGLDSTDQTFAVRIDAQQGTLADTELNKIIDSIKVH